LKATQGEGTWDENDVKKWFAALSSQALCIPRYPMLWHILVAARISESRALAESETSLTVILSCRVMADLRPWFVIGVCA